jgi:hypothetical protein
MTDENKIILDLCGGTGSWSRPYRESGYDVRIIDPYVGGGTVQWFEFIEEEVYGILAAPPCTHFSSSGAQYWGEKDEDGRTEQSLITADACARIVLVHDPTFWCLENPVGRLRNWFGPPLMYFDPCDYGGYSTPPDAYTKKTCLWGKFNVPDKDPVEPIKACDQGSWIQKLGGKSDRTKRLRSITPEGFSRAFFDSNR